MSYPINKKDVPPGVGIHHEGEADSEIVRLAQGQGVVIVLCQELGSCHHGLHWTLIGFIGCFLMILWPINRINSFFVFQEGFLVIKFSSLELIDRLWVFIELHFDAICQQFVQLIVLIDPL